MPTRAKVTDADRQVDPAHRAGADERFDRWFTRDYPAMVGVARRVLDRDLRSPASARAAQDIVIEAFSRLRWSRRRDGAATGALLRRTLDGCMDGLVGHPGVVTMPPDVVGTNLGPDGSLPLWELHDALASMRSGDHHVGLIALAGGYSPTDTAALLQRPLEEVLSRLARIGTRISDARRLGLVVPSGRPRREPAEHADATRPTAP